MFRTKRWYMSKAIWAALITGLVGTYMQVDVAAGDALPDIPGAIIAVLGALGIYSRKVADTVIE